MEPDTTQLQERLAQLPEDVRSAVLSVEWEQKVQAIGARHQLHIDQVGALGDATLMAMLGMFDLSEYPARLGQDVKVPADQAAAIAKEVSDEIFMPIRESLKKVTAQQGPAQPNPPTPAPQPMAQPAVAAQPALAPKPKPDLSAAETMLSASVVTPPVAPASAPVTPAAATPAATVPPAPAPNQTKPQAYTTDPYREPPVP